MTDSPKKALRREALRRLKLAAEADPAQLRSAKLRRKLAAHLDGNAKTVAIYAPLPHEVNLLPLLLEYPLHRFVFPLCMPEHQLEFRHVQDTARDMQPGAMNIPEPAAHTVAVKPEDIDLLIVPGVAFTRQGDRMGYGGGYYDRFIRRCTRASVLALAFEEQIYDVLPTEEHDLRIPLIITAG